MLEKMPGPLRLVALAACAGLLVGCGGGGDGPETESAGGTIMLDGSPLADASVVFLPTDPKLRMVSGTTDSSGYYELEYSTSQSGVQAGEYKVSISTATRDVDGNVTPERIPVTYNTQTELTASVPEGGGEFDFELTSDSGEIVQPTEMDVE